MNTARTVYEYSASSQRGLKTCGLVVVGARRPHALIIECFQDWNIHKSIELFVKHELLMYLLDLREELAHN